MSAVRRWNRFLRAVFVAIGALILGVGAVRVGVIEDPSVALWPAFGLLHLERLQGEQPLWSWVPFAAVQLTIWTLLAYLFFSGLEGLRRSASRKK